MDQRRREQKDLEGNIEELRNREQDLDDQIRELTTKKNLNEKQLADRKSELSQVSKKVLAFIASQAD